MAYYGNDKLGNLPLFHNICIIELRYLVTVHDLNYWQEIKNNIR
jgi:hypothetical protein